MMRVLLVVDGARPRTVDLTSGTSLAWAAGALLFCLCAGAAGMRLVGPNCMGVYSAPARLNGTYFWDLPRLDGGIGVVSQSGAYGGLIFRQLGARALGVRHFVSIGNQADVEMLEDLIVAAVNEAGRKADEAAKSSVQDLLGGLNIPGLNA